MPKARIVEGPHSGRVFELAAGPNIIGRTEEAQICLPSNQVSRRHACLNVEDGRVYAEDLKSSNGTYVNGARIQKVEVRSGNRVRVGEYTLEIQSKRGGASSTVSLSSGAETAKSPRKGKGGRSRKRGAGKPGGQNLKGVDVDNKVPQTLFWRLYGPLRSIPWLLQMFVLFAVVTTTLIFGVVGPLLDQSESDISNEALKRAETLVDALAMRNGDFIKTRNDIYYDTQSFREYEGVSEAYLLSRDMKILSPPEQRNQRKKNALTNQVQNAKQFVRLNEREINPEGNSGSYHLATPIRVWNSDAGRYDVYGYAYLVFRADQVGKATTSKSSRLTLYGGIITFVMGVLFLLLGLLTVRPLKALQEDSEMALRGDISSVNSRVKLKALEELAHTINRIMTRSQRASTEVAPSPATAGAEAAPQVAKAASGSDDLGDAKVEAIASAVPQGVLVLDDMQQVVYVNRSMERVMGRPVSGLKGRHVMEVVPDPAVLGTVLDLFSQIMNSPGRVVSQPATLNGRAITVSVSGVVNASRELKYAAVVMG